MTFETIKIFFDLYKKTPRVKNKWFSCLVCNNTQNTLTNFFLGFSSFIHVRKSGAMSTILSQKRIKKPNFLVYNQHFNIFSICFFKMINFSTFLSTSSFPSVETYLRACCMIKYIFAKNLIIFHQKRLLKKISRFWKNHGKFWY